MNDDWYVDFYQGMALDFWRQAVSPSQTAAEAEFLLGALGAPPGARLLDVPCGNGRLALALAEQGYALTGVDTAAPFLQEAQAAALDLEARGPDAVGAAPLEWRHGDMRELPWRSRFDGAYCFGNSFGYFDAEGTLAFLQAVARSLKRRGRFVLDTLMVAESLLPDLAERTWEPAGEYRLLVENEYRVAESRLDCRYTFVHQGREATHAAHYWVFTVGEVQRMLAACGLHTRSLFADLEQTPFELGAPRLLLVAEKA